MQDTSAQTPIVARTRRDLRTAFQSRIGALVPLFALCFAVVLGRLWLLQVVRYDKYQQLAERDSKSIIGVPALRAPILDRNGVELAFDEPSHDLSVRVDRLRLTSVTLDEVRAARVNNPKGREKERDAAFEKLELRLQEETFVRNLSATVQRPRVEIAASLLKALDNVARNWATPRTPQRVVGAIDPHLWQGLRATHEDVFRDTSLLFNAKAAEKLDEVRAPAYPGLVCTVSTRRVYPFGAFASHVLGGVGELSPSDDEALREDGLLLDNEAARSRAWSLLRENLNAEQAARLEIVLRKNPVEIETVGELVDILRRLQPHELKHCASLGLADAVRWCDRPPRMRLTEAERYWIGVKNDKDEFMPTSTSRNRLLDRIIGEMGIERYYNDDLRGKSGKREMQRFVRAGADDTGFEPRFEPSEGKTLALTISAQWQRAAENVLKAQERPGAIVVLDVNTGEVLALASWPDFDPNLFAPPRDGVERQEKLKSVLENPSKPLLNRCASEQYPLGSVLKTLVAGIALERGVVTPEEQFECKGFLMEGGQKFRCDNSRVHGFVNVERALRVSCNCAFHQIGSRMGVEGMSPYMRQIFGARTGLDLPGETPGIYPDRAWRMKTYPNNPAARIWARGHDYQLSIGQGMFTSTVLQAAVLMGAVANGGDVHAPKLWLEGPAREPKKLNLSPRSLDIVRMGLDEVVNCGSPGARGTAYGTFHERNPQLAARVAGKTSTAEHKKGAEPHAWFAGYAPVEKPQIAFAVMLEEAGHGGSEAAPLAYKMLKDIYGTQNAPIQNPGAPPSTQVSARE